MADKQHSYMPDYAVPPGETLLETLEALDLTQAELATRSGRPLKTINEIAKGKAAITPETALQFERVLGVPASFWNNRERQYREALAHISESASLSLETDWLKSFPVRRMAQLGWLDQSADKVQQLRDLLGFFGVASTSEWKTVWDDTWKRSQIALRRSTKFAVNYNALAAWIRRAELEGRSIKCGAFNAGRFRRCLRDIRKLTSKPPEIFRDELPKICSGTGVAVVFVPELPQTRISGATRWLSPTKALVALSLRYKSNDQLWFSFFHEASHILLHGKKEVFVECNGANDTHKKEREADRLAGDLLIPPSDYSRLRQSSSFTYAGVTAFAEDLDIAPGIVVGRLQHDGLLPHSHLNSLKQRLEWGTD